MKFLIRVTMHHKDGEAYELLHFEMSADNFQRTIVGAATGKTYKMNPGTYWTESSESLLELTERATRAARRVDPNASVEVCAGEIAFAGLEEPSKKVVPKPPVFAPLPAAPGLSNLGYMAALLAKKSSASIPKPATLLSDPAANFASALALYGLKK
jgi:hypothetical protein